MHLHIPVSDKIKTKLKRHGESQNDLTEGDSSQVSSQKALKLPQTTPRKHLKGTENDDKKKPHLGLWSPPGPRHNHKMTEVVQTKSSMS